MLEHLLILFELGTRSIYVREFCKASLTRGQAQFNVRISINTALNTLAEGTELGNQPFTIVQANTVIAHGQVEQLKVE